MKKTFILSLILILFLAACSNEPALEGLWVVKSVQVGKQSMTPNARWVRFHSDATQESGNGRFQHSYGTWKFNPDSRELTVENTNGTADPYEPFKVAIDPDEMTWERTEDGQDIKVTLQRATQLQETYGDQLLGLWKLEGAKGDDSYFEQSDRPANDYIFFRWDRQFVIGSKKGRINGVYNVNGHKPEVELIPYGDSVRRDFWKIEFQGDQLTLSLLNTDQTVTRQFRRIHQFPNREN
ncbi:MAG: hypothetical protein KDC56_02295 [Flavobacteriaceae bacterium]|nr:hypothetical protein [Flavobacteriaceae bacterium]